MGHVEANDGTRLHYQEYGSGRPLILIHGWTFSGRFFDRNIPALAEHARVTPWPCGGGHGDSDKPRRGYRIAGPAKEPVAVRACAQEHPSRR